MTLSDSCHNEFVVVLEAVTVFLVVVLEALIGDL